MQNICRPTHRLNKYWGGGGRGGGEESSRDQIAGPVCCVSHIRVRGEAAVCQLCPRCPADLIACQGFFVRTEIGGRFQLSKGLDSCHSYGILLSAYSKIPCGGSVHRIFWCGFGSVEDPGCLSQILIFYLSRILDAGSNNNNKRGGGLCWRTFFVSTNFTKFVNYFIF